MRSLSAALVLLASTSIVGRSIAIAEDREYRLIEASSVSELERALTTAAAQGFSVLAGADLRVVLRRDEAKPRTSKVIATTREATLIRELNEAGASGFSIIPEALMTSGGEWIVLLEKRDGATSRYTVIKGDEQGQRALATARRDGGTIVGVLGKAPGQFGLAFGGNPPPLILLQHGDVSTGGGAAREYRVLSTKRTGSLEKEIREAGREGFRPIGSGFMSVVLERDSNAAAPPAEYRVVATTRASTAEREIQALASEGFRIAAIPSAAKEWVFVLERPLEHADRFEYAFAQPRSDTIDDAMKAVDSAGFRVAGMMEHLLLLERRVP